MNMKMCGCCPVPPKPGYPFLSVGHGLQDESDEDVVARYQTIRKGLHICRGAYKTTSPDATLGEWSIALPLIDASYSDKNNVYCSIVHIDGQDDVGRSVTAKGWVAAGPSVDDFEDPATVVHPSLNYNGGYSLDGTIPGFTVYDAGLDPVTLFNVECAGESGGSLLSTSFVHEVLLAYKQEDRNWTDNGTSTAADRNAVSNSAAKPMESLYSLNRRDGVFAARFYGDKIGVLIAGIGAAAGSGLVPCNLYMGAQYATYSISGKTWTAQQSSKDSSDESDSLTALSGTEFNGPGGSTYELNAAARTLHSFDDSSGGKIGPWFYYEYSALAPYDRRPFFAGSEYYGEAKPIYLAKGRPDYALGFKYDSVARSGADVTDASFSWNHGAIASNVVGGSAVIASPTATINGSNAEFEMDIPWAYDARGPYQVLVARPGLVSIGASPPGGDFPVPASFGNASIIDDQYEVDPTTTYDASSTYRYESWYVNGTKYNVDRVAYITADGSRYAVLQTEDIDICPGREGCIAYGTVNFHAVVRTSSDVPDASYKPLDPDGTANSSVLTRRYVAYYDLSGTAPELKWVRALNTSGGFSLNRPLLSLDWYFESGGGRAYHVETGVFELVETTYDEGILDYAGPYDEDDYTTDVSGAIDTKYVGYFRANWTTSEFYDDGVNNAYTYNEAFGASFAKGDDFSGNGIPPSGGYSIPGQWGVVPGRDAIDFQLSQIIGATYPIYNTGDDSNLLAVHTEPITLHGEETDSVSDASTFDLQWPAVSDGDVAFLVICGPDSASPTDPDWEPIGSPGNTNVRLRAYYRVCDGSESGTIGVTFSGGEASDNVIGWCGTYTGVDTDDPTGGSLANTVKLRVEFTRDGTTSGTWTRDALWVDRYTIDSAAGGSGTAFDFSLASRACPSPSDVDSDSLSYSESASISTLSVAIQPISGVARVFGPASTGTPA